MGNDTSTTTSGWRVLATDVRGPCNEVHIIPFFEYIIGINGKRLDGVAVSLKEELQINCNKPTDLTILNYKTLKTRKITVCPSDDWGGVGLLGLIITYDNFKTADERVVRVLSVHPDSPAELAGLHPFIDYILGTESCIFNGIDSFEDYVSSHVNVELTLRVFNSKLCQVREVRIRPTINWGNSNSRGILGCEVSSGLLHKIPDLPNGACITVRQTQVESVPPAAGEETMQMTNLDTNNGEAGETVENVSAIGENSNVNIPTQIVQAEDVDTRAVADLEPELSAGENDQDTLSEIHKGSEDTSLKVDRETPAAQSAVETKE